MSIKQDLKKASLTLYRLIGKLANSFISQLRSEILKRQPRKAVLKKTRHDKISDSFENI